MLLSVSWGCKCGRLLSASACRFFLPSKDFLYDFNRGLCPRRWAESCFSSDVQFLRYDSSENNALCQTIFCLLVPMFAQFRRRMLLDTDALVARFALFAFLVQDVIPWRRWGTVWRSVQGEGLKDFLRVLFYIVLYILILFMLFPRARRHKATVAGDNKSNICKMSKQTLL